MKPQSTIHNCKPLSQPKGEEGIALVLTLLISVVLLGGLAALMMRMIGSRKLSTSESYQQLAEAAAVNGFNRILASLNNPDKESYLGFLYQVSNLENQGYAWGATPLISEPCAANRQSIPDWHSNLVALQAPGETARQDNSGVVTTHYRLRKYQGPEGQSSAQFEIEGVVKREGSQNKYEARSLLRRSLFVNSAVPTPDDWAVLAARDLNLGSVQITKGGNLWSDRQGPAKGGMIIKLLPNLNSFLNINSCGSTNLLASVGANSSQQPNIAKHIWPVANISSNNWDIPTPTYFNGDGTRDEGDYGNGSTRIWAFDDTLIGSIEDDQSGILCGGSRKYSIFCARPSSANPDRQQTYQNQISRSQIKTNSQKLCINKKNWGTEKRLKIYSGDAIKCDSTESKWKKRVTWSAANKILIKASDICENKQEANVCNVYIEHVKLANTMIFIETDINRPVVLKLQSPDNAPLRTDLSNEYSLTGASLICGIDRLPENQIDNIEPENCNEKPELFIVASQNGGATNNCNANEIKGTLSFGGLNLPAAWVVWPNGSIQLNADTNTKGIFWGNSICTNSYGLSLDTTTADNTTPIVTAGEQQWSWDVEKRYGRTVLRGIRGTGFDTFSRW